MHVVGFIIEIYYDARPYGREKVIRNLNGKYCFERDTVAGRQGE